MNERPIYPFDLERVLLGGFPTVFLIEVVLRVVVLFLTLVTAFRLMGHRMASQLTRNELLALVSLAAAVGPAVQDPGQGLLPPIVLAALVVIIQRALAALSFRSHRFENLAEGKVSRLVEDGILRLKALADNQVSRERLFAQLRREGIWNLGALERVYFEPDGSFTIVRTAEPRPGLSLVPEWDAALAARESADPEHSACITCGATIANHAANERCKVCGERTFRAAVHP